MGHHRGPGVPELAMQTKTSVVEACVPTVLVAVCLLCGCASEQPTTRPSSTYDRAEDALRNPFGYSPGMKKPDISGGGIGDFDREGFEKDLKDAINP